jgi:hypothetical protein
MSSQIVTYELDKATEVKFEVEPAAGFREASPDQVVGRVRDAVGPAVEAANVVLDKIKEMRPDQVELKFGIKVSGTASWLVARAAAEGNFEITLSWNSSAHDPGVHGTGKV